MIKSDFGTFLSRLPADFVGASTTLQEACERAELVAPSDVPVYLNGEQGSGRETFARAFAEGRFARLRCDRLTPKRWRALLTDSFDASEAFFPDLAGVLYLTEVDLAPKSSQRLLAERVRDWNARVVFSTSRSYLECRDADAFAPELDDLLRAFPIGLPNLKERQDDLPELARVFLRQEADRIGAWKRELTDRELAKIVKFDYPRNLDDLRVVASNLAREENEPFTLDKPTENASVDAPRQEPTKRERRALLDGTDSIPLSPDAFPSLDEVAVKHIEAALRLTNGVVEGPTGAADLLKINPYTLRSRMKKMKVDWTKFRDE